MSVETRSQSKSRKRIRPGTFDSNISTYVVEHKKKRNVNMAQNNDNNPQIRDMSQTILTRSTSLTTLGPVILQATSDLPNPAKKTGPSTSASQQGDVASSQVPVNNELQAVQNDIFDIRKTLGDLAQAVKDLANMTGSSREGNVRSANEIPAQDANSQPQQENIHSFSERNSVPRQGLPNARMDRPEIQNNNVFRIRVDKLGLVFDGNSYNMDVDEFVFSLEHLQAQYSIPWAEIVRDFHLLLSGAAWKWYWLFLNENRNCDWPAVRHALISRFQSHRSNFEIMRDLVEKKQQPNESIDNYFYNMCHMRSKLIPPITDYEMIKILKKNVRENISRIVYAMPVSSVEQLRIECNEIGRDFPRRENRVMQPPIRPTRHVNEVYVDDNESSSDVDNESAENNEVCELNVNRARPKLTCWNCHQPGHTFTECDSKERALFCYKCGHPNTITPKCPKCQSGNRNRGVEKMGGPRPIEAPTGN